jgi:hypothetical protein
MTTNQANEQSYRCRQKAKGNDGNDKELTRRPYLFTRAILSYGPSPLISASAHAWVLEGQLPTLPQRQV